MRSRGGARKGFGLVEAMMAVFVLSLLSLSIAYMYQYISVVSVKTLQNTYSTRVSGAIFSRLKTIEYYYVFPCDSSLPDFGLSGTFGPVTLQRTSYPYMGVLRQIDAVAKRYKIDRWTISVGYKMRDVSDVNANGQVSDLRDFDDANGDGADDYDPSIRYYHANADADHYDTYISTSLNKTVSEVPDTNLKEVTLRLYRHGHIIHTQEELLSLEMLSGAESKSSGAELKLLVAQPENNAYLYDLADTGRAAAKGRVITKSYPADIKAYRADTSLPLTVTGESVPLATVKLSLNSMGSVLDTSVADTLGSFNLFAPLLTAGLTEGENTIYAQATKDTFYSPYAARKVILDLKPPSIEEETPTGTVGDLMPYVGAVLTDTVLSTGIPSGICEPVTGMKINGAEVNFRYSADTGELQWTDPATALPVKLTNGNSYTVVVEGGDRAFYKAVSTWTFTVSVSSTDHSAPSVANKIPSGFTAEPIPEISCKVFDNQSGIDLHSITMKLDGTVVVSSANISSAWDAKDRRVFHTPAAAFPAASAHTVEISASHWADDPPEKKTSVETWNFSVNY